MIGGNLVAVLLLVERETKKKIAVIYMRKKLMNVGLHIQTWHGEKV